MDCIFEPPNFICPNCGVKGEKGLHKNCSKAPKKEKEARKQRACRIKNTCIHKGKLLRLEKCESCCNNTSIFVFSCTLHNECVIDSPGDTLSKLKHCVSCEDYCSRANK